MHAHPPALKVCAALFGLLAVSNLLKPLQLTPDAGFVFLGERLTGTANTIVGPLFGLVLAVYAAGIWGMRRWALPLGTAYLIYVVANLLLFPFRSPVRAGVGFAAFSVVYAIIAIGVAGGAVYLLRQHRVALS